MSGRGNAKRFDHLTGEEVNASSVKFEKWCIYDSKVNFFPNKMAPAQNLNFPI